MARKANVQATDWTVQDLNLDPKLPYGDAELPGYWSSDPKLGAFHPLWGHEKVGSDRGPIAALLGPWGYHTKKWSLTCKK